MQDLHLKEAINVLFTSVYCTQKKSYADKIKSSYKGRVTSQPLFEKPEHRCCEHKEKRQESVLRSDVLG